MGYANIGDHPLLTAVGEIIPVVPTRLEKAAKRFREAQAALVDARNKVGTARDTTDEARVELAEAIIEAAKAGMRQTEIVRVSGYTRERIRQICRAAGVDPAE